MNLRFSTFQDGNIDVIPVPQEMFSAEDISTKGYCVAGQFGILLSWHIEGGFYRIMNNEYTIEEETYLHCQGDEPALQAIICMEGETHFILKHVGEIRLQKGQFNIFFVPNLRLTGLFQSLTKTQVLFISFPVTTLQLFTTMFPLEGFLDRIYSGKAILLFEEPRWISSDFIIESSWLQSNPQHELKAAYLMDKQVKTLLLILLHYKFYSGEIPIPYTILEAIWEACHLIEAHIGEQLTVEIVAQSVNLSVFELRKYFKPVVGKTILEFITRSRLQTAKLLLMETDKPIKEIAALCGYDHEKNFITAFQNVMGYGPSFLRKGHRGPTS